MVNKSLTLWVSSVLKLDENWCTRCNHWYNQYRYRRIICSYHSTINERITLDNILSKVREHYWKKKRIIRLRQCSLYVGGYGVPSNHSEIPPNQNETKFISSLHIIITNMWLAPKVLSLKSGWSQDYSQNHQTFRKAGENPGLREFKYGPTQHTTHQTRHTDEKFEAWEQQNGSSPPLSRGLIGNTSTAQLAWSIAAPLA